MINRKYRILDENNQNMRYPEWIRFETNNKDVLYGYSCAHTQSYECDIENVMESTGLQDCEGRDIYDGDCVEIDRNAMTRFLKNAYVGPTNVTTEYDKEKLDFMVKGEYFGHFHSSHIGDWAESSKLAFKVIGNIYQNPELLDRLKNNDRV
jgi:uncharacterized phage protein (TIGR01671 family)